MVHLLNLFVLMVKLKLYANSCSNVLVKVSAYEIPIKYEATGHMGNEATSHMSLPCGKVSVFSQL